MSTPFALRLLGGATLLHPDGRPVEGRAAHRHPVALLARLALAPAEGVSRDKLAGLLWPERDEAAARQRLRGALHELRQLLGPAALPTSGAAVRLDARALDVDVHRLDARRAAGDHAAVVEAYRGPFLDGFFLEDAEPFEEWARVERGRLAGLHAEALERLARDAEARGAAPEAVRWWRALGVERPADGRVARASFDALVAAGDVGGALAHAAAHARHLREEFAVAPDPELRDAVATLRRRVGAASPDDEAPAPAAPAPTVEVAPAVPPDDPTPTVASPARARPRTWRRVLAGAGVVLAAGAAVAAAWPSGDEGAPSRAAPTSLAIVPFRVLAGAPPALGDGIATLLAATLDQAPELRVLPASVVAARTDPADTGAPPAAALRRMGAELTVAGLVAPAAAGTVVVTATATDTSGTVRARATARGPAQELAGLVDQVALALLRELWGRRWGVPAPRLAAVTTRSTPALRAYVRGEGFLREGQWDSAATAFVEATEQDSTFALAHLRLAETYAWRTGDGRADALRARAAARRFADRLSPRDRLLLELRQRHDAGDLGAVERADALAHRYPGDPEIRYVQADVRYHASDVLGVAVETAAIAGFDAALALDSTSARVLAHPWALALQRRDTARLARLAAHWDAFEPAARARAHRARLCAVLLAPPDEALRLFTAALRGAAGGARPPWPEANALFTVLEYAALGADAPRPDVVLAGAARLRDVYADDPHAVREAEAKRIATLAAVGRLAEARPLLARRFSLGAAVLPQAYGYAPPGWGATLDAAAGGAAQDPAAPEHGWPAAYARALLAFGDGDVRRGRPQLARAAVLAASGPSDSARLHSVRGLLRAAEGWARLAEGDSAAAFALLDEGLRAVGYDAAAARSAAPLRVLHARLAAGRADRRAEALDALPGGGPWRNPWGGAARLRALAAAGDAGAPPARARAAALWAGADPDVRARLAAMDARGAW